MASPGAGRAQRLRLVPRRALQRFKVRTATLGVQRLLWLFAVGMLSTACSSIDLETGFVRDRRLEAEIISQTTDAYPEIDPLYISADITGMLDRLIAKNDSAALRIAKIQTLLFNERYLNLQYSESQTLTADESVQIPPGKLSFGDEFVYRHGALCGHRCGVSNGRSQA